MFLYTLKTCISLATSLAFNRVLLLNADDHDLKLCSATLIVPKKRKQIKFTITLGLIKVFPAFL